MKSTSGCHVEKNENCERKYVKFIETSDNKLHLNINITGKEKDDITR